jgi:hypothetical protein
MDIVAIRQDVQSNRMDVVAIRQDVQSNRMDVVAKDAIARCERAGTSFAGKATGPRKTKRPLPRAARASLRYRFCAMGASRLILEAKETPVEPESSSPPSGPIPAAVSFDSPKAIESAFATASHEVLFAEPAGEACDVCGEAVSDDGDAEEGHAVAGHGLYVWTRGDETRREEPPLCPACAAALGLTALARWEIDEEEG